MNVRKFTDASKSKARSLSLEEWSKYEGSCLVQANLLESIGNMHYFVETIAECEKNYDRVLEEAKSQEN